MVVSVNITNLFSCQYNCSHKECCQASIQVPDNKVGQCLKGHNVKKVKNIEHRASPHQSTLLRILPQLTKIFFNLCLTLNKTFYNTVTFAYEYIRFNYFLIPFNIIQIEWTEFVILSRKMFVCKEGHIVNLWQISFFWNDFYHDWYFYIMVDIFIS